jgi:hypothetical protein
VDDAATANDNPNILLIHLPLVRNIIFSLPLLGDK